MARKPCKVDGCTSPNTARGWCNLHYRRWQRSGDPLKAAWERGNPEANFWAKVRRGSPDECWPWTGCISDDGYGRFVAPTERLSHRYAYVLLVGPVPDGLELDHLCHSRGGCSATLKNCPHRRCVNPAHLEPVTHQENGRRVGPEARLRRITKVSEMHAAKTHCPHGHEYTPENTYRDKRGARNCRTCSRERARLASKTEERRAYQREYMREAMRRRRAKTKQASNT